MSSAPSWEDSHLVDGGLVSFWFAVAGMLMRVVSSYQGATMPRGGLPC